MSGRSLRAAIDAKCKSCIHDPWSRGNWREQVSACSSSNCPLHPVRPISGASRRERGARGARVGARQLASVHGPESGLPGPAFGQLNGGAP